VLLQLPPRFYPTTLLGGMGTLIQHVEDVRQSRLRALTGYGLPEVRIEDADASVQALCSLALLGSQGRWLPGSLLALLKSPPGSGSSHCASNGLQQEYLELALQKWHMLHSASPTTSAELLFHLIHLHLYCSFAGIENTLRRYQKDAASATRGAAADQDSLPTSGSEPDCLDAERTAMLRQCFHTEENLVKATWHASRVLDIASDFEFASFSPRNGRVHLRQEANKAQVGEPVHVAHAVYHGTMVLRLWSILGSPLQQGEQGDGFMSVSEGDAILRQGRRVLSRLSSRVAEVFKQVLKSLQSSP
jgi:hypothetical protein